MPWLDNSWRANQPVTNCLYNLVFSRFVGGKADNDYYMKVAPGTFLAMNIIKKFGLLFITCFLVLSACTDRDGLPEPVESTPTSVPPTSKPVPTNPPDEPSQTEEPRVEDPIYLAIIWHQHQPLYAKDAENKYYVRPWVRVHATKDYVDMAAILEDYPDLHVTFNLTPSLIRQLDDLGSGAKDLYWVLSEVPAEALDSEQKQFILDRFFDTNRKIIARFPRYQALLDLRDSSEDALNEFNVQDYRDLQVLFNLAWVDPDWLGMEPLDTLVKKGKDFSEEDKIVLFEEHLKLIHEVIPIHRELQDSGQIEVTMTPYAHPILPLLVTTDLAREALPDLTLPSPPFIQGFDAVAQVELGVQLYEDHFGQPPRGMWPAEGAVAQDIISMIARNGIQWMASDEGVLANSLGFDSFTRDSNEVVVEADQLYRPYYVEGSRGGPVGMVFRDVAISDRVGFTYSGVAGEAAAQDFVDRIHAIREKLIESGAGGPRLVSVILDGENAWEYYDNDGKEFLHGLYRRLSEDLSIITVTPSEFLALAPDQPTIEDLWAGSWINHDYSTWIGEEEENQAWDLLRDTRDFLDLYIRGNRQGQASEEVINEALASMYAAEGSDWFWWYGADQNSGNDESFDNQYRDTLKEVYQALGESPPVTLDVPIIPQQAASADLAPSGLFTPTIDGLVADGEWDAAGVYQAAGGVMASGETIFDSLAFGFDTLNLYLKLALETTSYVPEAEQGVEIYLAVPGGGEQSSFSRNGSLLGFQANRLVELSLPGANLYQAAGDQTWSPGESVKVESAATGGNIELAIPFTGLGQADTGDMLTLRAYFVEEQMLQEEQKLVDIDHIPGVGPAVLGVPDLGTTTILVDITDPEDDDHGPGTYSYPTDGVFSAGSYDIQNFQVGFDDQNIVFRFVVGGPVNNSWDSPNGLSIQTFDIYLDTDGDGQGGQIMLPGRNLGFSDAAWDYAITVEGWESGIYVPGDGGPQQVAESSEFQVAVDPGQQKVTIRVPKSILGENPADWHYAAAVLSQEGYPSGGVMRVRDVLPVEEQWRIGGGPPDATNHTRVMDIVWETAGEQEDWLSDFSPVGVPQGDLTPGDFAAIPMFGVE